MKRQDVEKMNITPRKFEIKGGGEKSQRKRSSIEQERESEVERKIRKEREI